MNNNSPYTKLITEDDVKQITEVAKNVHNDKFAHSIIIAQDVHVMPLVGKVCFSNLINEKYNGTLSTANKLLLNGNGLDFRGLRYALAWWALYEAYPHLYANVTPTGIQTKSGDDYESISSQTLAMMVNNARDKAEYYTAQVIAFMCDNSKDYPCYSASGAGKLTTKPYTDFGISIDYEE
jgi:hypothetical protein